MLKILKNLKASWISVIIIILLLVLQATIDLALPDYTSKIVNIGIQQGGIENSSPEVLSKSTMENLLLFTEEKNEILENYTIISKNTLENKEYTKYVKKYPLLETEELYIRKSSLTEEQLQNLSTKMAKPLMIIQNLTEGETAKQIKQQIISKMPEQMKTAYEEVNTLEIIRQMLTSSENQNTDKSPLQEINIQTDKNFLQEVNKQIEQMPQSILEQAAINAIKTEYQKIGINTESYQTNYILWAGLQMLVVSLASIASGITIMLLSSRVAARLGRNLREKIFKKVLGFSTSEFKEFSTASLITRSTNDIQQIQSLINMLFRVVVYAPIIGIGGFFKVLATSNNSMAWIIGVAIGSILFIVLILFAIAMPKFKKLQELIDKLNLVSREMLTGIPVIRAFHTEQREEARFEMANKNLMKN